MGGSGSPALLGRVFAALEDLHLSANVASGSREPNAQDLFFAGAASGQAISTARDPPALKASLSFARAVRLPLRQAMAPVLRSVSCA